MPGAHGRGTTSVAAGLAALMGALVFGELQLPDATGLSPRDITQPELGALRFRAIGPAVIGGRISDLAVTEQDPRVIYAGAASGGVWKTRDGGHSWEPVFDTVDASSIGDVTVAPSQPDIVWVGTGEANSRENSGTGDGVYVSEDGGKSWRHAGLEQSRHVSRVAVDPRNPQHVLVAALGPIWRRGGQRGVFRTLDGGRTWKHVLMVDDQTGAIDVLINPSDPLIALAATYRTATAVSGRTSQTRWPDGEGRNGLYRSADGGGSWARVQGGFPASRIGRITLDYYRRNPRIVMALVEGEDGGVYRSEDGGLSWTRTNASVRGTSFISELRIDPADDRRIWVGGADPLYYSEDGGRTFCSSESEGQGSYCASWLERLHFDTHAIWINPANSDHMVTGNDGGVYQSFSRGRSWEYFDTMPLAQFHQIGVDMQRPYRVYGGTQDSGTWTAPSRTLHTMGIINQDWDGLLVGDGYYVQPDPEDPSSVYAAYQGGRVFRLNRRTNERRDILPAALPGGSPFRFESGNHPIALSPHSPARVYLGGNRLFISDDRGESWRVADIPASNSSNGATIESIDESPRVRGLLWIGMSDGRIFLSRDDGVTWREVTPARPAPQGLHVTRIIASRAADGRAYVTVGGQWRGDDAPYVFATDDYGARWTPLAGTLPHGDVALVIREHPHNADLLFLGTEGGLWASWSRGARWAKLRLGLPPARVHDLHIHPRDDDLIVGTHGRGMFVLDSLAGLAGMTGTALERPLTVFAPRSTAMWRLFNHRTNIGPGHRLFIGENPVEGAPIDYVLRRPATTPARIEIADEAGRVVSTLEGPAARGLNRVHWNLRHTMPYPLPEGIRPDPPGQPGGPRMRALALAQGPFVMPGAYRISVVAGDHRHTVSLDVREDSRVTQESEELRQHRDAWHKLSNLWVDGNALVTQIDALLIQVTDRQRRLAQRPGPAGAALSRFAESLRSRRTAIAGATRGNAVYRDFIDPGTRADGPLVQQIGQLLLSVGGWTGAPTTQQSRQIGWLEQELARHIDAWHRVLESDLAIVNVHLLAVSMTDIAAPARLARTRSEP